MLNSQALKRLKAMPACRLHMLRMAQTPLAMGAMEKPTLAILIGTRFALLSGTGRPAWLTKGEVVTRSVRLFLLRLQKIFAFAGKSAILFVVLVNRVLVTFRVMIPAK